MARRDAVYSTAMPAEAYAMYDLTTWGRSGSAAVVIREEVGGRVWKRPCF